MRAAPGSGAIEELPSGRLRVRLATKGKRRTLGPLLESRGEAETWRDALVSEIKSKRAVLLEGDTLAVYAAKWLAQREQEKGVKEGALRGALKHVVAAPFAGKRVQLVTRTEILAWLYGLVDVPSKKTGRPLAAATRRLIASTLSGIYMSALDEELVLTTPAMRLRVVKPVGAKDPWTYLLPEEQTLLLSELVELRHRIAIQFAMFTGVRSGEQWALELADVHIDGAEPHVMVRYGGPGHAPTKGRKVRRVPLLPKALAAVVVQKQLLQNVSDPLGLLFPSPTGAMRRRDHPLGVRVLDGKRVDVWKECLAKAFGPEFKLRWHDLRHTAGSSLISGWWSTPWRLEAIRDFLGHSAVRQTERYAHLAPKAPHPRATGSPREAHVAETPVEQASPEVTRAIGSCTVTPSEVPERGD